MTKLPIDATFLAPREDHVPSGVRLFFYGGAIFAGVAVLCAFIVRVLA